MNIGLVGCGRWGANILRDLGTLGADVYVVARSPASVARAKGSPVYPSISSLPPMEGIVIATPTSTHHDVVLETLSLQGCPVFVEKPLTASVLEAEELVVAGRNRLFVMDKWRYHPGVELLGRMAKSRELGAFAGVKTLRIQNGNPHPDVPPVWTYLPHDIAIIREILGCYPSLVGAVGNTNGTYGVAMFGNVTFRSAPWAVAEFSTVAPEKRRAVTAYFEQGTISLQNENATELVEFSLKRGLFSLPFSSKPPMPLYSELEGFLKFLDGGAPPKSSAQDGLAAVKLISQTLREIGCL